MVEWNMRVNGSVSSQSIGGLAAPVTYSANVSPHKQEAIIRVSDTAAAIDFIITSYTGSINADPAQCWMKIKRLQ